MRQLWGGLVLLLLTACATPAPAAPQLGSYEHPVPRGETATTTIAGRTVTARVVDVQREGDRLHVQLEIQYPSGTGVYYTPAVGESAVVAAGRAITNPNMQAPRKQPYATSIELYPGGSVTGWLEAFPVPADATPLTLNWERRAGTPGVFFALD